MIVLLLVGEMALRMGCFLSIIVIVGVIAWSAWNTLQEGIRYLTRLHQIPCSRCVYFTGDHRLKCPVHPIIALSEEAIACRDYEARAVPLYPTAPRPEPKLSISSPSISNPSISNPSISPVSQSSVRTPCLKTVVSTSATRVKR